jgi:hypothetical protein
MKFFDKLFGRKQSLPPFRPTNRLEHLLVEAADKPEKRPEFYRQLFHFDLLAIGKVEQKPDGTKLVSLMIGGTAEDPLTFLYTSAEALSWHLEKSGQGAQPYVQMKAHELLGLIRGHQGFLLNFGHDHGLHLPASQVEGLFEVPHTREVLSQDETINIGKPAELPSSLLATLASYKTAEPALIEIRFGLMQRPGSHPEYLYVLRFKETSSESEKDRIKGDIYRLTKDAYRRELPVNFLDLAESKDKGMWTHDDSLYLI